MTYLDNGATTFPKPPAVTQAMVRVMETCGNPGRGGYDAAMRAGRVMFLLFNVLFRLAIAFLPRSKQLSISWLQSPSAVVLEPRKIKSDTVSTVSPSISHEVMGPDAMIFVF